MAGPATAQVTDADRAIAENMMGTGRVTPDKVRRRCAEPVKRGEIVVCAQDNSSNRVESTAQSDPNSREALDNGMLHTPDVAGAGIFKGKKTFGFGSVNVPLIIDLADIPPPPKGSDADKIAKGELRAP